MGRNGGLSSRREAGVGRYVRTQDAEHQFPVVAVVRSRFGSVQAAQGHRVVADCQRNRDGDCAGGEFRLVGAARVGDGHVDTWSATQTRPEADNP